LRKHRDCSRAAGAIEDFGDGSIGRLRWMFLRRHVKDCPECATYFSRMSAVLETIDQLQRVQPPEDFTVLVMRRLLDGLDAARPAAQHERGRHNLLFFAAAGIGVAMALAVAVVRWALGREAEDKLIAAGSA